MPRGPWKPDCQMACMFIDQFEKKSKGLDGCGIEQLLERYSRQQDVPAVVTEDGRGLRLLVHCPTQDKKTQHQSQEKQPHQDLA